MQIMKFHHISAKLFLLYLWRILGWYSLLLLFCRLVMASPYIHSVEDVVMYLLFMTEDSTMFSERYSEKMFLSVSPGMDTEEIVRRLGKPISKWGGQDGQCEYWAYTTPTHSNACFWRRLLVFSLDGKVERIYCDYFDD